MKPYAYRTRFERDTEVVLDPWTCLDELKLFFESGGVTTILAYIHTEEGIWLAWVYDVEEAEITYRNRYVRILG